MNPDHYISIEVRETGTSKHFSCLFVGIPSVGDHFGVGDDVYRVQTVIWLLKRDAFGRSCYQPELLVGKA